MSCAETETPQKGFTTFERRILDHLYKVNGITSEDPDVRAEFLNARQHDGPSGVHYSGMGYDDEETQRKTILTMREWFYLYENGLLEEKND